MSKQHPANEVAKSKRAYSSPKLMRYGALRALTQAGTTTANEGGGPTCTSTDTVRKACTSDRAAKERIIRIGAHPLGIGLYLFDYKPEFRDEWGHGRQFGVMADEVEAVMPQAVCVHPDGYKMVNYELLGITRVVN